MAKGKRLDLTGQRFGLLTAQSIVRFDKSRNAVWLCICDCGKTTEVRAGNLRAGLTKSCGCLVRGVRVDLTGKTFGKLTVQSFATRENGQTKWLCLCECGKTIIALHGNLQTGQTQSCGNHKAESSVTHGLSGTPEYRSWQSMRQRCLDPTSHSYWRYGGRGITIDEEWGNFETFLRDMGPRPPNTSIHRVDGDGPYHKSNCIWADAKTQAKEKSLPKRRGLKKRYNAAKPLPGIEPAEVGDIDWFGEL